MTHPFPYWPTLPVKRILAVRGTLEFYLKARETSEQLIPAAPQKDGYLTYQFYYNKASKLIGYRFALDAVRVDPPEGYTGASTSEFLPRMTVFTSNIMASYVPIGLVESTGDGNFFVVYHDLSIRLIKYDAPASNVTYCILMRSKLDNVG